MQIKILFRLEYNRVYTLLFVLMYLGFNKTHNTHTHTHTHILYMQSEKNYSFFQFYSSHVCDLLIKMLI